MIDRLIIKAALNRYETPFYLFDKKGFLENYKKLEEAFKRFYPNYSIAYSYKTNYTPYICKLVKENGGFAEVVSDMEYYLAKKIGYADERIIYNGPNKGNAMEAMILAGGLVNIDNLQEATRVLRLAEQNPGKTISVGIRLNFDIGANYISRFGVEFGGDELKQIVDDFDKVENIRITGFHCHMSRARGLEAWEKRINTLLEAADLFSKGEPDYIDVGSGMFADMEESLASQFEMHIPTYDEYANVVAGAMAKHYMNSSKKPLLLSEPGTTVIARYFELITKIIQIKKIKECTFATVDASYHNAGSTCVMKKLPYQVIHNDGVSEHVYQHADIMGYTCLEQDRIFKDFPESICEGDTISFGNVGGYSIVSKPPFIQPCCPIYSVEDSEVFVEIKKKETYEDIFCGFVF